ncbi:hypothetical protein WME73_21355 [Sorangium sp. So ce302]|uniref:hypothetical protein n=1 Tax=Sorangium sp. So ce302 TaxID=3133297 RepID=UPI003F5EAB89
MTEVGAAAAADVVAVGAGGDAEALDAGETPSSLAVAAVEAAGGACEAAGGACEAAEGVVATAGVSAVDDAAGGPGSSPASS